MSQVVVDKQNTNSEKEEIPFLIENVNPFEKDSIWTGKIAIQFSVMAVYDCSTLQNFFSSMTVIDEIKKYFNEQNVEIHVEKLAWIDRHKPGQNKMKELKPKDHIIRVYSNNYDAIKNSNFIWVQIQTKDPRYVYSN